MKSKLEIKLKSKKDRKIHKQESNEEKQSEEDLIQNSLKIQQSAFVKEKIKEILEDGQKKTFITLKPRQVIDVNSGGLENRISVIRSVSSLLDEQKQIFNSSLAFPL